MVWKIIGWVLVLAVVVVAGIVAVGIYYSYDLTTVTGPHASADQQVLATDGSTVTLAQDDYNRHPGLNSLLWDDGHAYLGEQLDLTGTPGDGDVTYELDVTRGELAEGQEAVWSAWYFDYGDPSDRGLEFSEVTPRSDVGDLPSWYVPGDGETWTIVVHGINNDREESLRILPTLAQKGPVLVIRYRNDIGVPTSDNRLRLGDTEWRDVEAAMEWARGEGAEQFVLYGFSYGGAVTLQALDRAPGRDDIVGVVLDSPVVGWQDTLDAQAALRGYPTLFARVVGLVTEIRLGIDLADFDWVARSDELDVPILILHGRDDTFVPPGASEELAALRPDIVTLESFDGAQHVRPWNVEPERYEALVDEFLSSVGAGAPASAG
jgi:pimeloyl-ACP methyl ester carboxylesterase